MPMGKWPVDYFACQTLFTLELKGNYVDFVSNYQLITGYCHDDINAGKTARVLVQMFKCTSGSFKKSQVKKCSKRK